VAYLFLVGHSCKLRTMKIVSFYEMAPGSLSKVMDHYPAHRARLDEFYERCVLLMAGPLGKSSGRRNGSLHHP